jgi:hypothetical protein
VRKRVILYPDSESGTHSLSRILGSKAGDPKQYGLVCDTFTPHGGD